MHKLRIMKISRGNVEAKRNERMKRCIELDGKRDDNKKKVVVIVLRYIIIANIKFTYT